jgi:hypothetical protein
MAAVVGRVGATLSGIALAQNQGFGILGTVACAAGGFILGKVLDSVLEGEFVEEALKGLKTKALEQMDE